ncbi:molybdopterin-dependent oxidoreductase, partial [Thermodesulfobacteriota bacterium]
KEGSYDKEYVKTHVVGFNRFKDYVLGKGDDSVPKAPAWASGKCGVPEWTIKALAREFAAKTTSIAHFYGGSMIRGPYSHEPARLEACLLGMQGLGRPGVHQMQFTYAGMPRYEGLAGSIVWNPEISERLSMPLLSSMSAWQEHIIPKVLLNKALTSDTPLTYKGSGSIMGLTEDQFVEYTYPRKKEEGGCEVRMIWMDAPCRTTCWNHGNETERVYRNPKLDFILVQHPWLENDCIFADMILPSNTTLEVEDIVTNVRQGLQFPNVILCEEAVSPVGESKSDFEVVLEIADKLGLKETLLDGHTTEDLQKEVFTQMGVNKQTTWEDFKEKSYYLYQVAEDWEEDRPGFGRFYDDPEAHPLATPTGKLEFYSERLAEKFPDDRERGPMPKWIEKSETHDERLSSERARKFSLLLITNHSPWRVHTQCDDITWTREIMTCKITGPDGYKYEPLWLHPSEAEKRGIKSGDIVKLFNERGIVLAGAYVTERLMPGIAYIDHGARIDPIKIGEIDRGGAVNTISPGRQTSKNCAGQATSGYLVEVEKLRDEEMEQWKRDYPEAFEREYHPDSGICFNAWVEEGDK